MIRPMHIIFLILTLSLSSVVKRADSRPKEQTPHGSQQAAIQNVLTSQQTAWNQGDVVTFMQGYWNSPELTFAGTNGITRGYSNVLAHYKQAYPDQAAMGHLEFSDVEIQSLGDNAALVLGKWHLTRQGGDVGGVFSLVFQRFPEGWKIVHDHTSQTAAANP